MVYTVHYILKLLPGEAVCCPVLPDGLQQDKEGNKTSLGELPDYLAKALRGVLHLNNTVEPAGNKFVFEKAGTTKGVVIGTGFREVQLDLALSCGQCFKRCKVCSVTKAADLLCPLCSTVDNLKQAHKAVPSKLELGVAAVLREEGLLSAFRFQAKVVQGWAGAVDFYHPASGLIVQVDDPHHFHTHTIHQYSRGQVLSKDMAFNKLCWDQGFPLLRVAKGDMRIVGSLLRRVLQCTQHPSYTSSLRLMVLSSQYITVKAGEIACYGQGQDMYTEECELLLGVKGAIRGDVWNSVWYLR